MEINLTLLGQSLTFALFVWFTMRYVWPPVMSALEARQAQIAQGLASAREGEAALVRARGQAAQLVQDARDKADTITQAAERRASEVLAAVEQERRDWLAKAQARLQEDVRAAYAEAQAALQRQAAHWAMDAVDKLMGDVVDAQAHEAWLSRWIQQANDRQAG